MKLTDDTSKMNMLIKGIFSFSLIGCLNIQAQVAYYPFNGNATDVSGNGNNGVITGATLTTDRFGIANSAYFFNGSSLINCGNGSSLKFSNEFTVCTWIKTAAPGFAFPIEKGWSFGFVDGTGKLYFRCDDGSFRGYVGSPVITNNHWHFIVAQRKGSIVKIFTDGLLSEVVNMGTLGDTNSDSNLRIGYQYSGILDDIRIFNRALTVSEIITLFHEGGWNQETVLDVDGNLYNTVKIGTQTWMTENLKTTKYNDGQFIPYIYDNTSWSTKTYGGYCQYNHELINLFRYGNLYNWSAVNTGKLCPVGWHVPQDAEWSKLVNFLGGANIAGDKLKESGTIHWTSPNYGTNESGFTAFPGSSRDNYGNFANTIGTWGLWWTSSEISSGTAARWTISNPGSNIINDWSFKADGLSVRCIKGESQSFSTQVFAKWNGNDVEDAMIYLDRGDGFQLVGTTTSNKLSLTISNLKIGYKLKAVKQVYIKDAIKSGHEMVDNTMFELWVNSDIMNKDGSYSSVVVQKQENTISLNMDHYIYKYNLVLTTNEADWSLSNDYYEKLVIGFKEASKLLYNSTDGQVMLNKIAIYDNRTNYRGSDIVLFRDVDQNSAKVEGIDKISILYPSTVKLNMHRLQYYHNHEPNQNDWYHSLIHEFGHFGFGFYDEWLNGNGEDWDYNLNYDWDRGGLQHPYNYGLMQTHPDITEFSSSNDYLIAYSNNYNKEEVTYQYEKRKMSCWDYLEKKLENYYSVSGIKLPPYGYYPDGWVYDRLGPDDNSILDSTIVLDCRSLGKSGGGFDATIIILQNNKPIPNARVYIDNKFGYNYLGQTDKFGSVDWSGAKSESLLTIYTIVDDKPLRFTASINDLKKENLISLNIDKSIAYAKGDIPGINLTGKVSDNSTIKIDFELFADHKLDVSPRLVIFYGVSRDTLYLNDLESGLRFGNSFAFKKDDTEFDGTGLIEISYKYNSVGYNAISNFKLHEASFDEPCMVFNRSFNLNIQEDNFSSAELGVSFNTFGKPYSLSNQILYPVTDVFSIGMENTQTFISGAGFNVSYSIDQVLGMDLSSLGIYKWDKLSKVWNLESTSGSNPGTRNLSCFATSTGIYGVFANKLANDNTPPSRIVDLFAKTGQSQSTIDLSWTSSGDDGTSGKAIYYVIKYNEIPITEVNWEESYQINNNLVPLLAGQKENISVKMPNSNGLYYFAIKSIDEAGNIAELSNITSSISALYRCTFSLLSPAFNEIINDISPIFKWESYKDENITGYSLMISENELFENPITINNIETNNFEVQSLLTTGKIYFWKVIAVTPYNDIVESNQSYMRLIIGPTTAIGQHIDTDQKIGYCYPNPFNPDYQNLAIRFFSTYSDSYTVRIYDQSGKQVKLINGKTIEINSEQVIYWDGTNEAKAKVFNGLYLYQISSSKGIRISGKILVSR